MRWVELVGSVVVICLVGFFFHINALVELRRKREFALKYRRHFIDYTNSVGGNREAVQWLHLNSNRMQTDSGSIGIFGSYTPAGGRERILNYPVFLNMVGEIEKYLQLDHGTGIFRDAIQASVRFLDETILRNIGSLNEIIDEHTRYLKNPVRMFGAGVRFIVRLPIAFLYWSGIISYARYTGILGNPIIKFVGFCVSVFGLLSGVVSIVTGWSQFIQDIHGMLR